MADWLLKTEPSTYSFADLEKAKKAVWDGVTNPVALKNLRAMKAGDRVVVYHTGDEKAAVGLATVTREAYPDPKGKNPRLVVVDLAGRQAAAAAGDPGRDEGPGLLRARARWCGRGGSPSSP